MNKGFASKLKTQSLKMPLWYAAAGLSVIVGILIFNPTPAKAASSGITVSPAFQMVSIPRGASQQPVAFTITNDQTVAQKLNFSVSDFGMLNESGGLFFVGTNPTALQKKYGLAKWVSLPADSVTIPAKQTFELNAEILNLPTLTAGGHYGALLISLGNSQPSGGNQVGLHPIASSLMFVTKLGGDTHDLRLSNVYANHSLFQLPNKVTLRFYNAGNTHLVPRGLVSITTGQGRLISKGIINENSEIILPQAYRQLAVSLRPVSAANSIGQYKLTVDFRFDGDSQFRAYQASLFVLPPGILVIITAVIAVLAAGGLTYYRIRHTAKDR